MERSMRLMHYAPTDWLDVVAMRVEGTMSSWVNAILQDVAVGRRAVFHLGPIQGGNVATIRAGH